MHKFYSLVASVVMLTGCSYKNDPIELSSYKTQYLGKTTQNMNSVSLSSVTDTRENKTSIGYVEANGHVTTKLYSYVNFADRYREGLARVLKLARFNLVNNPLDSDTKIDVKIKDIQLIYNDTNKFDENLQGKIIVEVTLTKADKVNVLTFTQKQGTWIKPSYTSKDIEPFLDTLFTDSIDDIVSTLAKK